jgi:small subunit ribosomal protein S1
MERPLRTFKRGEIIKGKVVKISKGEVLVDVGGRTEGIVAGREIRLEDEKFDKNEGDEVLVYVIKGENNFGQIELSIRRTGTARKWFELVRAREEDKAISVEVIEANTGGVIVSIGGGLRGFIPTSQLDNARIYPIDGYGDKDNATKQLQNKLGELIGTEISVKVVEIDREKNRVILSEKMVTSDQDVELRKQTLESTKVGDVLSGEVTGIAPFGLFINAQGLEGLVHLSEISWDKVTNPADFYKIGDKIKVQVIGMQDNGKRVAYSVKRLQRDPWDEIVRDYKVGQVVKGIVTKVVDYGAFVRIDDKVNGLIHISEMSDKLVKNPRDHVKEGDEIDLKIISISKEERHLGLSIKRMKLQTAKSESAEDEVEDKKEVASEDKALEMVSLDKILGE